ncbi:MULTISPECIES: universal stress protein [Vibrio]|uniref:Universal stress protein n=1 Tax=Vibrio alfacsensis TaxID=1074311 RepID=A0ABN5PJL3_9VIBR|nr:MULTISPECIES: universal stress protein [Vibrio]AXY03361.1 universal stress global response regulator UspA [Vibrio alfacsensis]WQE78679.1 universal stress protein [Vibrio alfacsensis]CAE6918000.1 COG0589 Universal stress protein UspA and related nucleotide-binding proteins [Vibrio sp. B1REV9]BBM67181.1 universal stress protein [Vibrio alfacsensis]BCN26540.1 universal stress protein [Vibrio alfacsensis]
MKYKHILVALELSDESTVLIDRAVSMANYLGSEISFIHIDGTHGEIYPELVDLVKEPSSRPLNEHSMESLRSFGDYIDHPLKRFFVGTGDLADKLDVTIKEEEVDLLICGHHQDFWSKIISYSRHLINKCPVDILVVPIRD